MQDEPQVPAADPNAPAAPVADGGMGAPAADPGAPAPMGGEDAPMTTPPADGGMGAPAADPGAPAPMGGEEHKGDDDGSASAA